MTRTRKKNHNFVLRRRFVLLTIAICFIALFVRAIDLKFIEAEKLQEVGSDRHFTSVKIPAHRGVIYDRNGELLAISTPVNSVWVNPKKLQISAAQLKQLAKLLGLNPVSMKKKIDARKDRQFMFLKRRLTPRVASAISDMPIKGVYLLKEYRRYYPTGEMAVQLIGLTDIDDKGQEGLELSYDDWLQGRAGSKRVLRDATGKTIANVEMLAAADNGKDLHLSIDKRIQYSAYKELKRAVLKHHARAGSVVVMSVHTGEVLALANMPSLNPNNRSSASYEKIRNRAITDEFEPGSTLKPFVIAAALESKVITPETQINTAPGYFDVGAHRVTDVHNYGVLSIDKVLVKSSNVAMSKIALEMTAKSLWQPLQRLGFGETTGSGFPGETAGQLSNYYDWNNVIRVTHSYGYGVAVSALQLARAYSALGNGGVLLPATLLKAKGRQTGQRVFKSKTAYTVVSMLEKVATEEGTARRAAVAGYRVAGKTGTVHKAVNGGYADNRYLSLFAGLIPASSPQYAIVVMIDEPRQGDYFGGLVAGPVFSNIAADLVRVMNVLPDQKSYQPEKVWLADQGSVQ